MCVPACSVRSPSRFPHLFSTCEETCGGTSYIYVPVFVVFLIALLWQHGTLKPLFSKLVEVSAGCSRAEGWGWCSSDWRKAPSHAF